MKVSLVDICDFQGGTQPPKEEWIDHLEPGYIRMLQIRDFTQPDKDHIEYIKETKTIKTCVAEDILIGRYGASVGKILTGLSGAYNVAIIKTIPDNQKILNKYLFHYLNSPYFQSYILSVGSRAAQAGFNKEDLKNALIALPSMDEQSRIVFKLDLLDQLISLRKQQLATLDELVKARFVEMFGDPITNSKCLAMKELREIITLQRGYDLPVQSRDSNGNIPVYGSNGVLDYHSQSKSTCGVITGRSGTIGKVYYCKENFWPLNTTLFSIKIYNNNIVYLAHLLEYYKLERFCDGTGVPTLNRNVIHRQPIIDVPVVQQKIFAAFVEQTARQKLTIQQSLDKLEVLKKSLMQEYFG